MDPWNDPAPICGSCHQEAFRLLDGLCPRCSEGRELKEQRQLENLDRLKGNAKRHGLWVFAKGKAPSPS